jgi:hypothetical protein
MGSSSEHFRTSFVRLIQTRPANWGTVWRLIVEHPWYQQQLHACAERLLRRFACRSQSVDDVKHEAMLLLARDVERTTDLGLNASEAGAHFVGWMRTIGAAIRVNAFCTIRIIWRSPTSHSSSGVNCCRPSITWTSLIGPR